MASAASATITNGGFVLEMYDHATKQPVWTTHATKTLSPGDEKKIQKNLDKAMQELLTNYPPKEN